MDIKNVITFENFCRLYALDYNYRYMDRESHKYTYFPRRMTEPALRNLYDKLSTTKMSSIQIIPNCKYNDGIGSYMICSSNVEGFTDKENVRDQINLIPGFDEILNGKNAVIVTNLYGVGGKTSENLLTALITNTYPSITSFPFKDAVHTVIDVRKMTSNQWYAIIAPKITSISYSRNGQMTINLKEPMIKLMEGI